MGFYKIIWKNKISIVNAIIILQTYNTSQDVLGKLFSCLSAKKFTNSFTNWVNSISDLIKVEVVDIDGKTIRNSNDDTGSKSSILLVSVFADENKICLGQEAVHEKSNKITATPNHLRYSQLNDVSLLFMQWDAKKK